MLSRSPLWMILALAAVALAYDICNAWHVEEEDLSPQALRKTELIKQHKLNTVMLETLHRQLEQVDAQLHTAEQNRSTLIRESESLASKLEMMDSALTERLHDSSEVLQAQLDANRTEASLHSEIAKAEDAIHKLRAETQEIVSRMSSAGFDDWLENRGKYVLSKAEYGFLQKSRGLTDPLMSKVIQSTHIQSQIVQQLKDAIPVLDHPMISGALWFFVIMVPFLFFMSIVVSIVKGLKVFTSAHYCIFNCIFLSIQGLIFFSVSMMTSSNGLVLLRKKSETLLSATLLIWLASWFILAVSVSVLLFRQRDINSAAYFIATLVMGLHFRTYGWRPAFADDEIRIWTVTYLIYAISFGYIAFSINSEVMVLDKSFVARVLNYAGIRASSKSSKKEKEKEKEKDKDKDRKAKRKLPKP